MVKIFNLLEAGLWISVAVALLILSKRLSDRQRRPAYVAAAAFFLFGVSDLIEIYTGAWWRPLWLLLWKGSCIVGLVTCLIWHLRARRK